MNKLVPYDSLDRFLLELSVLRLFRQYIGGPAPSVQQYSNPYVLEVLVNALSITPSFHLQYSNRILNIVIFVAKS